MYNDSSVHGPAFRKQYVFVEHVSPYYLPYGSYRRPADLLEGSWRLTVTVQEIGVLTGRQKRNIRAEELYRAEVRRDLEAEKGKQMVDGKENLK